METNTGEGAAVMTAEARRLEIPLLAARIVMGAQTSSNWHGKQDTVRVYFDDNEWAIHVKDYDLAAAIAGEIKKLWIDLSAKSNCLSTPTVALEVVTLAAALYARRTDNRAGKKGIIMLSDNDGCGFWRMRLPARFMPGDGWFADITSAVVKYERLLEYDTIFVQRFHEWDAFYVLEKLKKAGKRIIYDIDDDLFSIPRENPAANVIRKDQQFAALEIMRLADVVIAATPVLKMRLEQDLGLKGKVVVVPNALDLEDMVPTALCGSPDGVRRIFWQGGTTHAEDWTVCLSAIEKVMQEENDIRLTLLGFLPPIVLDMVKRRGWHNRVEHSGFSEPETYYQMIKHVRAEVGLAPLIDNQFNRGKSPLKLIENSVIGMPTVASRVAPYESAIEDGKSGYLVSTPDEWYLALKALLSDEKKQKEILTEARKYVAEEHDIRKVALEWSAILCQ